MNTDNPEIPTDSIAETENYTIWTADEPDGEVTYHLELGPVTAHFFQEEWDEFVENISLAAAEEAGQTSGDDVEVEMDWGSLYFTREEWEEFLKLINQAKSG